ncbi:MAG: LamG-like jellyroll fold domain-containing protein [Fuerstiella sp.]
MAFDDADRQELETILCSATTSTLDEHASKRLSDLVTQHEEAGRIYAQHCQMHAILRESTLLATFHADHEAPLVARQQRNVWLWWAGLAAAVCLLVAAGAIASRFMNNESDNGGTVPGIAVGRNNDGLILTQDHDVAGQANVNDTGVAVLTRVAGLKGQATANWQVGQTIPPGLMVWDKGVLQLEFYGGATVVVEGPAEIEILDESRVVCRLGRLRANVPEPARGFAVLAPAFELVDLGTEFGLSVMDDGKAEVHVFDGKVELYDAESNRSLASRRELNAGDAIKLDRDGTAKDTAVQETEFVTSSRLSMLTDARRVQQLRNWHDFRDSLQNDQRVVAFFPFEKRLAKDRSLIGDGTNDTKIEGAIVGCEWTQGRWPGKTSLQFKRPGDRVRVTVPGQFDSLTYSTWVRVDGLDRLRNSLLLTDGFRKNGIHWQLRQDGSLNLGMRYANNRAHNYLTKPIFDLFRLGQWVHLATVYDTEEARVSHYVNGQLAHRQGLKRYAVGKLKIGKATIGNWSGRGASDVRNFNGCMDELIVFGEALNDEEIRGIYELGRP